MRGGSVGTSESQDGARESLKGHIAFVVDNMNYYWTQGSVTIIIRNDPNSMLLYLVHFGIVMIVTGHCDTGWRLLYSVKQCYIHWSYLLDL